MIRNTYQSHKYQINFAANKCAKNPSPRTFGELTTAQKKRYIFQTQVKEYANAGLSAQEIATCLNVNISKVYRVLKSFKKVVSYL